MDTLYLVLYIVAGLCFLVSAFSGAMSTTTTNTGPSRVSGINLLALGLLAWVLVPLIQHIDSM